MSNVARKKTAVKADLLRSIARMYYILGMNQQEIAQKLNIGRSSVARFLAEARSEGIVEIKIKGVNDYRRDVKLEDALCTKYELRDVVVSSSPMRDYYSVAADYLSSVFPYDGIVLIGGGATLYSIMQLVKSPTPLEKLICMQSTGVLTEIVPSTAVVQICAANLSATAKYINLPGIVTNAEIRQQLMSCSTLDTDYRYLKLADILICSIGNIKRFVERTMSNPALAPYRYEMLDKCVGDVFCHMFDKNGVFCMPELSACVFGLSADDFLKIPIRIGAAYGDEKVAAIRGALTGHLINILLTDTQTAIKLV